MSVFEQFLPSLLAYLQSSCSNFRAGSIATKFTAWTDITNDKEILSDVSGVSIECTETPVQHWLPPQKFDDRESDRINHEINKLVEKRVIEMVEYNPQHILSSIFLTPKRDGSYRLISNLKKFNRLVVNHNFKMDSLYTIIKLLVPNCFMATIDLKDAYYSVPIKASDRKLVSFKWKEQIYQFTCLPNGLSCAPRKFTKILNTVLAHLHTKGHISVAHLDDLYLQGQTYEDCIRNVIDTTLLLETLGFLVHPIKSILVPTQEIVVLGFVINSLTLTVMLTKEKAVNLKKSCTQVLGFPKITIRQVAKVIGQIVSSFPGAMHGPLYYRNLESNKSQALKTSRGDFDAHMSLSMEASQELNWWIANVETTYNVVSHDRPQHTITTDASLLGWGAVMDSIPTGGNWTYDESLYHINYLEMYAILLALKTFATDKSHTHIRIMTDNSTAVSVINHMGTSHSHSCNSMAKKIWEWCIERNIWLSVAHIPGKDNFVADFESRRNEKEAEWMLSKASLQDALSELGFMPEIDLFASRINNQFTKCVSYKPDPSALAIDAFTLDWSKLMFYAFPPFSVIPAVLSKIVADEAMGVCILPDWPTQGWYPKAIQMLVKERVILKARKDLLSLPSHPKEVHPLWNKLTLMVCFLSGTA